MKLVSLLLLKGFWMIDHLTVVSKTSFGHCLHALFHVGLSCLNYLPARIDDIWLLYRDLCSPNTQSATGSTCVFWLCKIFRVQAPRYVLGLLDTSLFIHRLISFYISSITVHIMVHHLVDNSNIRISSGYLHSALGCAYLKCLS